MVAYCLPMISLVHLSPVSRDTKIPADMIGHECRATSMIRMRYLWVINAIDLVI
ncbi:MAG: hypothetical protein OHK0050_16560 [Roseiflexaceae bacterium]